MRRDIRSLAGAGKESNHRVLAVGIACIVLDHDSRVVAVEDEVMRAVLLGVCDKDDVASSDFRVHGSALLRELLGCRIDFRVLIFRDLGQLLHAVGKDQLLYSVGESVAGLLVEKVAELDHRDLLIF